MTDNTTRARITRGTRRIGLPIPDATTLEFSISGTWRDTSDDPDATAVTLHCAAYDGRKGSYRLTRDATFRLPPKTMQVQLEVSHASDRVDLKASLKPYVAPPQKPKVPERCPIGDTSIERRMFRFDAASGRT